MRIQRRVVDRLLSIVRPVHRYQCVTLECGWQGNLALRPPPREQYLTPLTTTTRAG
jgi:hypothetical protein